MSNASNAADTVFEVHPRPTPQAFKVCLLGPAGAGKTSLLGRWLGYDTELGYHPTVGANFHAIQGEHSGVRFELLTWDTAGQERYATILPYYLRGCDVAVLVFDAVGFSKGQLEGWLPNLCYASDAVRLVLVANKSDLLTAPEEAAVLALLAELSCSSPFPVLGCFTTSALSGSGCVSVLEAVSGWCGACAVAATPPEFVAVQPAAPRAGCC